MKNLFPFRRVHWTPLSILAVLCLFAACHTTSLTAIKDDNLYKSLTAKRIQLPNQWKLTPAGTSLPLGDLPLNMVVSPSKKMLAVTNNGVSKQKIQIFNIDNAAQSVKLVSEAEIPKSWYGLAFSKDEKRLFSSGGNDNTIVVYSIDNQTIKAEYLLFLTQKSPKY